MANFDDIIQEINTNLPDNNAQLITAKKLRDTLVDLTEKIDDVNNDFVEDINTKMTSINKSFINISNNILNPATITTGRYVNNNTGATTSSSNYWCTDYIPIDERGLYCNNAATSGVVGGAVYDTNYNYIRGVTGKSVTYQAGDAYVRFSISNTNTTANTYVTPGTTEVAYEEYNLNYNLKGEYITDNSIDLDKTTFYSTQILSNNILNPATITTGRYVNNNTGATTSSSNYWCTDYIPIDERGLYCNNAVASGVVGGAVYDTNYNYIRGVTGKSVTYQAGDAYVRFSISNTNTTANTYVNNSTSAGVWDEYEDKQIIDPQYIYINQLADNSVSFNNISFKITESKTKNILDPTTKVSNSIASRTNGAFRSSTTCSRTDYIPIDERGLYCNTTVVSSGSYIGAAVIYNSSKQFVRSQASNPSITYQEGDAYVIFNFFNTESDTIYVCRGTTPLDTGYVAYEEWEIIDPQYINADESINYNDVLSKLNENGIYSENINISLPNKFYAVVGDTLQLFYQGMIVTPNFRNYDVWVSSSRGKGLPRYFEYTPTASNVGTSTLTINIANNNGDILGTNSCNLVTINTPSSPASNKNILCIGDSLTAGGLWVCELKRRLTGDIDNTTYTPTALGLSNISFIGSMNTTKRGVTANFYGKSGWGWSDFCTDGRPAFRFYITNADNVSLGNVYSNNGYSFTVIEINNFGDEQNPNWTILCSTTSGASPASSGTLTLTSGTGGNLTFTASESAGSNLLWDSTNNRVSIKKYAIDNCGLSSSDNVDYVFTLLTWNQLPSSATSESDWNTIMTYIKQFADSLHTDYPNAKWKIMGIQLPYMESYISATNTQHTFNTIKRNIEMNKRYQEFANDTNYSDFVEFINISAQFDSEYNYPYSNKNVNTRNSSYTERYVNNSVHPGDAGYLQIADAAYRNICNELNS